MGNLLKSKEEKIERVSVKFINAIDDRVEIRVYLLDSEVSHVALRVEQEKLIDLGIMNRLRNLSGVADRLEADKGIVVTLVEEAFTGILTR